MDAEDWVNTLWEHFGAVTLQFSLVFGCAILSASVASLFYWSFGFAGRRWQLLTGWIGVPFHELSHLVGCIIFGMRVNRVSFYKPDPESGQLGFVSFSYNPRSVAHRIGLFVVGVAPFLAGAAVIFALLRFLGVGTLDQFMVFSGSTGWVDMFSGVANWLADIVVAASSGWVETGVLILAGAIALHSSPSWADIRIAGGGVLFVWLLGLGIVLGFFLLLGDMSDELRFLAGLADLVMVSIVQLSVFMLGFAGVGVLLGLPFRLGAAAITKVDTPSNSR